jgi:IstB-like ATP binding protein
MALLEIIEDRHGKGSVIITSQLPVSGWYDITGEKIVADSWTGWSMKLIE